MGVCACPGSLTDCGGECVNTNTDPKNCGSCKDHCGDDEFCNGGNCVSLCEGMPPKKCCGGSAIDITSDNNNCGDCGIACDVAKGYTCVAGECRCPKDTVQCDGQCKTESDCICTAGEVSCAGSCVDLQADAANCGSCGHVCPGPGGLCVNSRCRCPPHTTSCPSGCVDLRSNPSNCGGCGFTCPSGSCIEGICQGDAGVIYPPGSDGGSDFMTDAT